MIHSDGTPTIANREGSTIIADQDWRTLLEQDLIQLDRLERERLYRACREHTENVFDWLACLDGATSGT